MCRCRDELRHGKRGYEEGSRNGVEPTRGRFPTPCIAKTIANSRNTTYSHDAPPGSINHPSFPKLISLKSCVVRTHIPAHFITAASHQTETSHASVRILGQDMGQRQAAYAGDVAQHAAEQAAEGVAAAGERGQQVGDVGEDAQQAADGVEERREQGRHTAEVADAAERDDTRAATATAAQDARQPAESTGQPAGSVLYPCVLAHGDFSRRRR